jgi:membrane protease YdiL (CAAX protease family)
LALGIRAFDRRFLPGLRIVVGPTASRGALIERPGASVLGSRSHYLLLVGIGRFRHFRGGFKPILQGFGYALALRLGLVVVIIFAATLFLMATGTDPKQFAEFMKQNQPQTDSLFPKGALANPLYLLLMTTLLSFVVAGVREEFWRNATLAALRHLLPDHWGERARWITAIALSSVVFGLGHLYQGGLGVVFTALLGAGLGAVTWRHRSIWPSVFAHGFIDATSFLAAAAMASKKVPIEVFWFWR